MSKKFCGDNRRGENNMDATVKKPSILDSIREGFEEVKLHKEGKIKLKLFDKAFKDWLKWSN